MHNAGVARIDRYSLVAQWATTPRRPVVWGRRTVAGQHTRGPGRRIASARAGTVGLAVGLVFSLTATACSPGTGAAPGSGSSGGAPSSADSSSVGTSSAGPSSVGPSSAGPSDAAPSAPASSAQDDEPSGPPSCRDLAGELSLNQRIGQLFMAGTSTEGMSEQEADRLAALKVGSVVVLGNTTTGRDAVAEVTDSIRQRVGSDHGVKVLLAADQEGGQVQRLAGPGFDSIPSASEQAEMSDRSLRRSAKKWGKELKRAGVDADLAPVADVVPESIGTANEPIGALDRGYGSDVEVVAAKNSAFIAGMHDAGRMTAVKHFPGLGKVRGNTDFSAEVVDDVTTADDPDLESFRAAMEAGTEMVMMSSATYSEIDADGPAAFSSEIISGMLRDDFGYDKVVISDALEGEALGDYPVKSRALRFLRAGGDLALVGAPDQVEPMVKRVRKAAHKDEDLQQLIMDASTRVLIMKAEYGLADCTP